MAPGLCICVWIGSASLIERQFDSTARDGLGDITGYQPAGIHGILMHACRHGDDGERGRINAACSIALVAPTPSSTGMRRSMKTRSNGLCSSMACSTASIASSLSAIIVTLLPVVGKDVDHERSVYLIVLGDENIGDAGAGGVTSQT